MEEMELIVDAKADLGEGPSWDADKQLLYWVDINRKWIHTYDPATGVDRSVVAPSMVGAVVPRASGGWLAALEDGFYAVDPATGAADPVARVAGLPAGARFNDGKCDACGRFLAGTMTYANPGAAKLYALDETGALSVLHEQATISNGIAWSPDNATMYYVDSHVPRVMAFDYDLETGRIANPRVVIEYPGGEGGPDGMTSDREGCLWIASWGGYKVSRWDPATGRRLVEIAVPAPQVTSCVFGGPKMDELYITTARTGMDESLLANYPNAGGLFRIKTGTVGMPTHRYRG